MKQRLAAIAILVLSFSLLLGTSSPSFARSPRVGAHCPAGGEPVASPKECSPFHCRCNDENVSNGAAGWDESTGCCSPRDQVCQRYCDAHGGWSGFEGCAKSAPKQADCPHYACSCGHPEPTLSAWDSETRCCASQQQVCKLFCNRDTGKQDQPRRGFTSGGQ